MKTRAVHVALGVMIGISIVGVLFFGRLMAPARNGTSADFWESACGVDIRPGGTQKDIFEGIYLPRDGYYIYYYTGIESEDVFKVPRQAAVADLPKVARMIQEQSHEQKVPYRVRRAAMALAEQATAKEINPEQFLASIRKLNLQRIQKESNDDTYRSILAEEPEFDKRWAKMKRFWLNELLEIIFFSGLSLFAIWPWMRQNKPWKSALHLGLLPILLVLPYYCGYAAWTFTSVGPSGGAFYPLVIWPLGGFGFWTSIDDWVLQHFPKFLAPLSQDQGPMLAVSGGRGPGLVQCLVVGIVLAAIALIAIYCSRIDRGRLRLHLP